MTSFFYQFSRCWILFVMVLSFIVGVLLAVTHHLFYKSLIGKPAQTNFALMGNEFNGQQLNLAIGTGLSFLAKASLTLSVSTAYYQLFWIRFKKDTESNNSPTLGRVDSLLSGLTNVISFLTVSAWYRHPLLFLLAAIVWLLPLVSILTPTTLSVSTQEKIQISNQKVPRVNFSNLNFMSNMELVSKAAYRDETGYHEGIRLYWYKGPSRELKRIAINVATQNSILPIEPLGLSPNSSWAIKFDGPSLKCGPIEPTKRREIQINIPHQPESIDCSMPATFLSWRPRQLKMKNGTVIPQYYQPYNVLSADDPIYEPGNIFDYPSTDPDETNATLYFAIMPEVMNPIYYYCGKDLPKDPERNMKVIANDSSFIECQLYKSTYYSEFKYTNNIQSINTTIADLGSPAYMYGSARGGTLSGKAASSCITFHTGPEDTDCEYDTTLLSNFAYQSIFQAFTQLVAGNITRSLFNRTNFNTRIVETGLMDTEELSFLTEEALRESSGSILNYMLFNSSMSSNMAPLNSAKASFSETLEKTFQNITLSLMASNLFQPNYSSNETPKTDVTQYTTKTFYTYRQDRLWASYGAGIFCTLFCVTIGVVATISSRLSYSNAFSTTYRIAKATTLDIKIEKKDLSGISPLPTYLADARIKSLTTNIELHLDNSGEGIEREDYIALLNKNRGT